ncbi:MAG: phosphatase PAP2 family protein, partial [Nanoarchaeota archaeon]
PFLIFYNNGFLKRKMKISKKIILLVSLLVFIFILIQILISNSEYKAFLINLDLLINSFMPKIENNFLTTLSKIIAIIFDTITLIIISIIISVYLWAKDNKRESLFFVIMMLLTSLVIFILKNLMQRARPLNSLVFETGFAFPSGHTTASLVFFGVLTHLILVKNKSEFFKFLILGISIFIVAIISFSRLYLNSHWMTDVLGGLALGFFILTIFIIMYKIP